LDDDYIGACGQLSPKKLVPEKSGVSARQFRPLSGWALAFELSDFLLFLLDLIVSTEGLRAIFLELLCPVGERRDMHFVGASNLRVGPIGLKRLTQKFLRRTTRSLNSGL